jgi:hypothetical protein
MTVIRAIDMAQTLEIARCPKEYLETNTLLGDHPSQGAVVGYFLASHALMYLAADAMPHKWRKGFLAGGIAVSASFVQNNYRIGLTGRF